MEPQICRCQGFSFCKYTHILGILLTRYFTYQVPFLLSYSLLRYVGYSGILLTSVPYLQLCV